MDVTNIRPGERATARRGSTVISGVVQDVSDRGAWVDFEGDVTVFDSDGWRFEE